MIGATFGAYRVTAKLGGGGMGEVFLAEDTKLKRKVAIKVLLPDLASGGNAGKRLLREARAAAALDHPNICAIYDVAEHDGRTFIVMQYVEGETLHARMRRGAVPFLEVLSIARQVADALSEAHTHDTIHRDIKPANIMVSGRGLVKVMDFGLATSGRGGAGDDAETTTGLTSPGAVLGTVPYMSPEQVRGEPLDARSDLFSLGIVLYELVTGHQPFAAPSSAGTLSAILTEEPQPLGRYSKDATAELERIVFKTLRKDREARYQTAKDLLIDLRAHEDEVRRTSTGARSGPASGSPMAGTPPAASSAPASVAPISATDSPPAEVSSHPPVAHARRWRAVAAVAAIVALGAAGFWFYRGRSQAAWAREQIPRIEALVAARDLMPAYDLAVQARRYLPADPVLTRLMPIVSDVLSVSSDPPGATVYLTRPDPGEPERTPQRRRVGVTPIDGLEIARGAYLLAIERDGYAPIERPISGTTETLGRDRYLSPPVRIAETLQPAGDVPERMVFVPGGEYRLVAWSRPTDDRPKLDDYLIDKYEVSNQDYSQFVSAGGYLKKEYWKHQFVESGRVLPWEDAMKVFTDRTGLPGPRNWSQRKFPPGLADHPVTGVSWYEAAAYAAFRGKELPTVFQWEKAARNGNAAPPFNYMPWGVFFPGDSFRQRANFDGATTVPVTANPIGASPFGAYNMAGNVAEWCQNDSDAGHFTSGGAFGDPSYMFARFGTFPGFYSSDRLGFRTARRRAPEGPPDAGAMRVEISIEVPKFALTTAAQFEELRSFYRHEKTALAATITERVETPDWDRETIAFNGADGERAIAYLYLPTHVARPVQVVHYVPGTGVELGVMGLQNNMEAMIGASVRAGRAMFGVALRGYQERRPPGGASEPPASTAEFRDKIVNWITDLRRGLDYLETRADIDHDRIAFVAQSAGARTGIILAAIEPRYRSVFFQGAGVGRVQTTWVKGTSPIDFAPHIKGPTMMMQGRHDEAIRLTTNAEPLFALLKEPKRLVLYDGGHMAPTELFVKELNAWLDQTLGPVKR